MVNRRIRAAWKLFEPTFHGLMAPDDLSRLNLIPAAAAGRFTGGISSRFSDPTPDAGFWLGDFAIIPQSASRQRSLALGLPASNWSPTLRSPEAGYKYGASSNRK